MGKTLILYYSYEGSTETVAKHLADKLDSDIEKINPVKEMKSKGFAKYIWGGGQVTMKKKPEIEPIKSNLELYDLVLVGSPIWAGTMTPPIYTLFEDGIIKGKKIGYFYCSAGGAGKASDRAKISIDKYNSLVSSCHLIKVYNNHEKANYEALNWAKELI
ncbi:MAG TPA: hypothetical protein VJ916_04810 [Anaerovoracaceae bacterium]|nr:hypothetical protein [Anaerovoracaceae bacterium]